MNEIQSKYDPLQTEDKWYSYWNEHGFFSSTPDHREPYCIVIPPPNVTGVLHMGHMLNNTLQDVFIRRARMKGKNALWLPGTDHASIATEARVVAKLKNEGINKSQLSREQFINHAWEWKEKHGGIILEQLKKLGASCDWRRTKFTMDADYSESVLRVFIDLYNKGYIYRGIRMINWDPQAKTAVSDEEVIYKEELSTLYYVRYKIDGEDNFITIATTRPETILGDTAVCINPTDERYTHLRNKKVIIPLINRIVPIIQDEYVDKEFGTGCLKITPAHDINDYEIGIQHNLQSIDIFNDDGTLNEKAQLFIGEDRFKARTLIVDKLKQHGYIVKEEKYNNKIGYSERTNSVIEPKLSLQWFLKMKELSKPALENVLNGNINIVPEKFKNTYRHWMENVKDWCISRQLWWGHRIPAYYTPNGHIIVALNFDEAAKIAEQNYGITDRNALKQDDDVLDTWFSSWLWPIAVFDGIRNPNNADIKYYYPTNDLITAPEILFFWVARMIIAGYEYRNEKPFHNVYLTGIVRDKQGRKMSKSLGNSPEPLELIKKYGADGVRVGMLLCSPAGNDLLYDDDLPEQGRNFCNKIWNAYRLVKQWKIDENIQQPVASHQAVEWFNAVLCKTFIELEQLFIQYRVSEALMTVYKLFWDEFCSWYLEIIKPGFNKPIDCSTYNSTINFFENLLLLLHPFMPFITEEIWQNIKPRNDGDSIMITQLPQIEDYNKQAIICSDYTKEVVSGIRTIRKEKNILQKETLELFIKHEKQNNILLYEETICKLCNIKKCIIVNEKPTGAASFRINTTEFFIPVGDKENKEEELKKVEKELEYTKGFLASVISKLNNEHFVKNAPSKVIDAERKKQNDAEAKIKLLEQRIAELTT